MVIDTLARCLESGDFAQLAPAYSPNALLDAHVPNWRFQLEGPERITGQFQSWWPTPGRLTAWGATATDDGFVVQFERWWQEGPDELSCRQLHLLRLEAGSVVEQVVYCAGRWGADLRAKMAAASPLVRA